MKKETERKKKYLDRYRIAKSSSRELEQRLRMLQLDEMVPGQRAADAMPHGSGGERDLSDYAAKYDEYFSKIIRKKEEQRKIMMEISTAIDVMEVEEEKQVLLYRYIHLMRWEDIAAEMHVSLRTAFNWHGSALRHFQIPESVH